MYIDLNSVLLETKNDRMITVHINGCTFTTFITNVLSSAVKNDINKAPTPKVSVHMYLKWGDMIQNMVFYFLAGYHGL